MQRSQTMDEHDVFLVNYDGNSSFPDADSKMDDSNSQSDQVEYAKVVSRLELNLSKF